MVVITGGAGYIGSYLTERLIKEKPLVVDNFSSGNFKVEGATYLVEDLRLTSDIKLEKGCTLYHLAANPDVRTSMESVGEHFDQDVRASLNVAEICRKSDCEEVIFTSSSTVYGETRVIPTPEESSTSPISYYGVYKLMAEEIFQFYSRVYGIRTVILRLANVVGGSRQTHGIVPDFIKKLMRDPTTLEILGNGEQRKSYIYISDVIDAMIHLAKVTGKCEVYNLGNSDWVTVKEIASIVEGEMGLNPQHKFRDAGEGRGWKGDVREMLLDIRKMLEAGVKVNYSSSEDITKATDDVLRNVKPY
ncbi:NAD-dependent dehydratase [Sulfolobales archaeon HS-7]|nr:NAD-dependent dehydratase [Sulfolobales archaeon HS-7]